MSKIIQYLNQLMCKHSKSGHHLVKMISQKAGFWKYQCCGCNKDLYIKSGYTDLRSYE